MKACIWFFLSVSFGSRWLPPIYWEFPVDAALLDKAFYDPTNYLT